MWDRSVLLPTAMSVQSSEYEICECWKLWNCIFFNTTCPLSEDVAVRGCASCSTLPALQICPDFCGALTSLLWLKCKAKQPALLYISQPVPADMCSLKHFWARDTSLVCSVLLEREGKKEKNVSYFFLSLWQRVTFFDISTESLVLQRLLSDALIESPMSNRKRNKCFIELELSLVMLGGRDGKGGKVRSEQAAVLVFVCVGSLWEGYSQPSV